jgi:uncharacterized protein (DUF433 family)
VNVIVNHSTIGIGAYTVPEAARLLKIPSVNIRRWIGGYNFQHHDGTRRMPPLWKSQLPIIGEHLELGFRDLIELMFVGEFLKAGLTIQVIRHCLEEAKKVISDHHPFSTRRFKTDGRTIFVEGIRESGEIQLLDLKKRQYTFKDVIEQSFKDLDIEDNAVTSWRPFRGRKSIVIDPQRSFGQPIAADFGVPTAVLAQAVLSEGSIGSVARLYEVPTRVVKDAVAFEHALMAA